MAEGKKQRKFGRNGRSNSSKLQVARTAANKARNRQKAGDKWMDVPRGSARACRRALTFYGKVHAAIVLDVSYSYAEGVVGKKGAEKLSALFSFD